MERTEPPLVVIVGPTASGKTALAIELALWCGGEIICADSRTVYKGMDIGTAKPTEKERSTVPHWGLDLVEPGERYTAADFKEYATKKISEIRARGHVPFLVGGTGLYIDGVLFDYQFGIEYDPKQRAYLESLSTQQLQLYCSNNNIILPKDAANRRRIIRAIEQNNVNTKRRISPIENTLVVGIATEKEELRTRIANRAEQILTNDVVEEAIALGRRYGWESEAMTGNIYPLLHRYVEDRLTLGEMKAMFAHLDWQLAKRQLTWFRRNPYIIWVTKEMASSYLQGVLAPKR